VFASLDYQGLQDEVDAVLAHISNKLNPG